MKRSKSAAPRGTEYDFKAIKKRFVDLNQVRLSRTRAQLKSAQRDFIDLLPLLFHTNHAMLPGYVSKDTPAGIPDYEPSRTTLAASHRLARSFSYRTSNRRHFPMRALYFMGSPGSMAFAKDSDFDIWVCHDPELTEGQLAKLQEKCERITAWAETLDVEAHFFLVDPTSFRSGQTRELSSESSGSAQHNLLLEEFYRTGVCIAGQYPMWWLVPPEHEEEYDAYVADMTSKRFVHIKDMLDLGGLSHVPAEEFFGAAVWQLYKGIDSPYKSVLKLLLIEAYASGYPKLDLLSGRFKRAVYDGEANADRLDPYLMMLQRVEEYLNSGEGGERHELARHCFYFKVDESLSADRKEADDWRRRLLRGLVKDWGWSHADLLMMDSRPQWKVNRVVEERRILFDALSQSYRFLSNFARANAGLSQISKHDLNVLGRKLYAAFERKPGKVELINRGIASNLAETHITLQQKPTEGGQFGWLLFQSQLTADDAVSSKPIKQSRSVVSLIAWCYFNRVIDRHTSLAIQTRDSSLNANEFRSVLRRLAAVFPPPDLHSSEVEAFTVPARVTHSAVFVNVGVNPFAHLGGADEQIASNRTDALSYGGAADNLVLAMDLVQATSWQEVMTYHYRGGKGVMDCLCEYLKWAPPGAQQPPKPPQIYSFSAVRSETVAQRITQLFRDVAAVFYGPQAQAPVRYLVAIGRGYFILEFNGETPRHTWLENYDALLRYLSTPQAEFSPLRIDREALNDTVLPLIYERNRPGYVQLFYRTQGDEADVYVLDERGSMFYRRLPFYDADTLLGQYSYFFEEVLNRINFLMQEGHTLRGPEGVELFAIGRDSSGRTRVQRRAPQFRQAGRQYFSLQVLVDTDDTGRMVFTLYCDNQEFSSLEYGRDLFNAVAAHVLKMRASGQTYPIYITDISMSRQVLGENGLGRVQTVNFLNYKQRIEDNLNRALQQLK